MVTYLRTRHVQSYLILYLKRRRIQVNFLNLIKRILKIKITHEKLKKDPSIIDHFNGLGSFDFHVVLFLAVKIFLMGFRLYNR